MNRTAFALVAILALLALPVAAEPTADPNHPVYEEIDRWYTQGLIDRLPVMRPYPRATLIAILEQVAGSGSAADRARAETALVNLGADRSESISAHGFVRGELYSADDEVQPKASFGVDLGGELGERLSFGAQVGAFAIERGEADLLPYATRSSDDVLEDNAKVTVSGRDIYTLLQINTQTTFDLGGGYLQAGISRRSFGPFHDDSPVVSRNAPQAGNLALQWDFGRLRYTGAWFSHTATAVFRDINDPTDSGDLIDVNQDGIADFDDRPIEVPGKNLFIHSFSYRVSPRVELSIFEAMVWGPRVDLAYLVPLKFLWHAQGTANFADNALIGLSADIRPAPGWRIPLVIFVDDASFNDLAALNFDTKYKMATAAAVQWAPRAAVAPTFQLAYETVFPYMYTHAALDPYATEANYNTYLHQRESIGSSLLPNSDRVSLEAEVRPLPWLELGTRGAIIRHANASEGELDQYLNDGGYFDNGREGEFVTAEDGLAGDDDPDADELYWTRGDLTYNGPFRFLTQDTIETRYQAGISATITGRVGAIGARVVLGYTFEYVQNPIAYVWSQTDTQNGGGGETISGDDEVIHYGEVSVGFSY